MADFTWKPTYVYEPEDNFTTLASGYENEATQYRSKVSAAPRIWHLNFQNQTTTVKEAIQAFFRLKKGRATSFTWLEEPERTTEYTVRFGEDKIKWSNKSPGVWDFAFTFIEEL